jgi:hypothetical protein
MDTAQLQLILAAVVGFALTGCAGDPTDNAMIKTFQEHRHEFEALKTMVAHDQYLNRVDIDWTQPDDPSTAGVTPERIAEYRRIFQRLGITRGFQAYGDRAEIEFIAHAEGLSVSGHAKSYCWRESPPPETVNSIDALRAKKSEEYQNYLDHKTDSFEEHVIAYRHIDGHWYLAYKS